MEDTGAFGDDLQPQSAFTFLDEVRVDQIFQFLMSADRTEVTVHVRVLDRELVVELEGALELEQDRQGFEG